MRLIVIYLIFREKLNRHTNAGMLDTMLSNDICRFGSEKHLLY